MQLNKNQIITLQTAILFEKEGKFICGFNIKNKETKEFLKPFYNNGWIDKEHIKFAGAFKLTKKGREKANLIIESL